MINVYFAIFSTQASVISVIIRGNLLQEPLRNTVTYSYRFRVTCDNESDIMRTYLKRLTIFINYTLSLRNKVCKIYEVGQCC